MVIDFLEFDGFDVEDLMCASDGTSGFSNEGLINSQIDFHLMSKEILFPSIG